MFAPRYATLAAPLWCAAYLAWNILDLGQRGAMASAIYNGVRLHKIVQRYYGFTYYGGKDVLAARMRMLHDHSVGIFRNLRE
jgi:hypothetical protein